MTAPRSDEGLVVLHEDAFLFVVSKPAGLLSVPSPAATGRTVLDVMRARGLVVVPVHRLDRDVSGVMLLAREEDTRAKLEELFRARHVSKLYWALAQGHVRPAIGSFDMAIKDEGAFARVSRSGQPALTKYRTRERFKTATEVEIDLITGRYNQIRLHFATAGFPLVGERKYARGALARLKSSHLALHAERLSFPHPHTGKTLTVVAPLPPALAALRAAAAAV